MWNWPLTHPCGKKGLFLPLLVSILVPITVSLTYHVCLGEKSADVFFSSPSITLLSAIYLSHTKDLYLWENMPPTELRMSVKQWDLKSSVSAYTPWINRGSVRDEEPRHETQSSCFVGAARKTTDKPWFEFWSISPCFLRPVVLLLPCQCQVALISLFAR